MEGRAYLRTHPQLTFAVDASTFSPETWMLLGAIQSKCAHIQGVPLDDEHAAELYRIYLTKGTQATTAIEGNTLTEEEVRRILEGRSDLPPSRQYLEQEVQNILDACNRIADACIEGSPQALSVDEICAFNRQVLDKLRIDDAVVPGRIRTHSVGVSRYKAPSPQDCGHLLHRLCDMINTFTPLGERWPYASGVLKAVVAHVYLAWIHPFGDGNGRTARLVELKLCAAAGIPKPACQLLSNFYNKTRSEYYRELEKASLTTSPSGFIRYALAGLADMLDEQLNVIRAHQLKSAWENLVHTTVKGGSVTAERRRALALDLYTRKEGLPKAELKTLSLRLAGFYAGRASHTAERDVKALRALDLVETDGKLVRPNLGRVLAWLPRRRLPEPAEV